MYHNHHHHDHVTRGPHVQVNHGHHRNAHHGHYHGHYYQGTGGRSGALLIGALIVLPIFIVALILKLTLSAVSVTAASLTTAGAASVGAGSALAFSAATFGFGALIVYGAVGLAYLYSSAKECYSSDKNVFDMVKSRVANEDGLSLKGVAKSIGAVLWSPFLFIGGLAGMGAKAAVNAFSRSNSSSSNDVEMTSYSQISSDLPSQGRKSDLRRDKAPVHTDLFSDLPKNPTKESEILDDTSSLSLSTRT